MGHLVGTFNTKYVTYDNGNNIEEAPNNEETPNNEDNEVTFYLISKATGSVTDNFFDGVYKFSRGE